MLNNATITKLREMKLSVMADAFVSQLEDKNFAEMTFDERVGMVVDAEYTSRKNNRLNRLIRNAEFVYPDAALENIEYHADRKLDKAYITRLGTCNYIGKNQHIIILGATGNGKSYIANALGMSACRNFITVKYIRLPDLLAELAIARVAGNYGKMIKQYRKVQLLIIDEWLISPLKESESRDLLEIMEGRYKKASTILCSQSDVGGWFEKIGETTLADAIVDRIIHDAHKIIIEGKDSMRKRKGMAEEVAE